MTDSGDDRWLSVKEIARHLGVTTFSVYRWIEGKGLPARRVGRSWRFKKDEVDRWVESGLADSRGDEEPSHG